MSITRATVQAEIKLDLGSFISKVRLDSTTINTPNGDMEGPIRRAIIRSGGTVANPPTVTDADISTILLSYDRFMLFVRLYMIDRIWGNWAEVDQKQGDEEQSLDQLTQRLERKMKAIQEELKEPDVFEALLVEGPPAISHIKEGSRISNDPFDPYNSCGLYPIYPR